jgi:hypothetical protein
LADELSPDQKVEQEYVEDVNDKDGSVLHIDFLLPPLIDSLD